MHNSPEFLVGLYYFCEFWSRNKTDRWAKLQPRILRKLNRLNRPFPQYFINMTDRSWLVVMTLIERYT